MGNDKMRSVAQAVPTTEEELSDCGVPMEIQKQYGERLLKSINSFIEQNSLQQYIENRPKKKKQKTDVADESNNESNKPILIDVPDDVDEFDDVTLLFTDMVGFTHFSKNVKDPKEVGSLLSKLFSRLDQLCEDYKVYKVHTIGDCYVIMGYNGRVDKNKRFRPVVVDEANKVI